MTITILFGGSSYEHEVSIVSAITMKKVLKKSTVRFIFVDAMRDFYLIENDRMKSSFFASGEYKKSKKLILKKTGFFSKSIFGSKAVDTDVLLNLIHGRDGEDGKIAALLSFYSVLFISPRTEASVLSYNKLYTKSFARSVGVQTIPYEHLSREDERKIEMGYPVIVKPVRLGSSIGLSVVRSMAELDYALDVAFEFDSDVIIEPFVEDVKEYNLAGAWTGKWELSMVEEPQKDGFLDFEKKYMDFSRDSQIREASISNTLKQEIQESFKKIYNPLFHGSIVRCDFFEVEGEVYLNEINPVPGSMANYLFSDFEDMFVRLSSSLPSEENIVIDYQYINSIQSAKGKA
ncbi:MAG: D-alanine--D-alanine ligase [Sulfurovum sp.]|nr:D-alanine--D-alanine ligase [Sulfurovum sp.]